MSMNYWSKQPFHAPLFPGMAWSKPENKLHAGKLLIVGGNAHGFSSPATAFSAAEQAGVGMTRVLLPDAVQKTVKAFMPEADFAPSTPSGSFAVAALDSFLENAGWSDAVAITGDLGKNSETAILLESFITKYPGLLSITQDALDYLVEAPSLIIDRENTLITASTVQLQKLFKNSRSEQAITHDMGLVRLAEALHEFTDHHQIQIITKYHDTYVVAVRGQISTTKHPVQEEIWRVKITAKSTVWWLQHPLQSFQALTTSLVA